MKKIFPIAVVTVLVAVSGTYFVLNKNSATSLGEVQESSDISTWKTYQNKEYGFSINLPRQYVVKEEVIATSTEWGSRGLVVVSRFEDKTPPAVRPTYGIVSVQVNLQRQPVVASGQIFHNVADFYKSGYPDLVTQGIPDPVGRLVVVNGTQLLTYHTFPGDTGDYSGDIYFFIKDDLIYEFSFDAADPNEKMMLESITWQ